MPDGYTPRMFPKSIVHGLLLSAGAAWAANGPLIRMGDDWHYFKSRPGTAAPDPAWTKREFDSSRWRRARSGFVIPEEDHVPPGFVRRPAQPSQVYLRRTFQITDPLAIRSLLLQVEHEQGFTAYLNGVPVTHARGPGVRFPTAADLAAGWEDPEVLVAAADLSEFRHLLAAGDNLIALEGAATGESPSEFPIAASLSVNFTRGPFVQNATSTSMQIIWRTATPMSAFVEYGLTRELGSIITREALGTNHVVTLSGLGSDTAYYYRAGSTDSEGTLLSEIEAFRTLKTSGPITFMVIGDSGQNSVAQGEIANVLLAGNPDLVLHTGDIVYGSFNDGTADTRVFNYYQPHMKTTPYFMSIGNHDLGCCIGEQRDFNTTNWVLNATNYQNTFYLPTNSATGTEHFYSFDHGDVHFVALYNPWFAHYVPTNGSDQYTWLTNDLAASAKPWKMLYFHMPLANSGVHGLRNDNGGPQDSAELMALIGPIAQQYGVQLVFSGHDHNFERFAPTNGLHHLVTGGGGGGVYQLTARHIASAQFWAFNHATKVTVNGDTATIEAFGTATNLIDAFVIHRALAPTNVLQASWNTPLIESAPADNQDGNVANQEFDLIGRPILTRHGQFANLGEVLVNNDATNLYVGIRKAMFYRNANLFLFIESPGLTGVPAMAGVGNGLIDPDGEGADGLDCLENLSFTNFAPGIGCVLGDEFADATIASFSRPGLDLNIGQGVFRLGNNLSPVTSARLQQFNRSPESPAPGGIGEQSADLIEIEIPLSELGGLMPGDFIQIGLVAAGAGFDETAQTRQLDSAALATHLSVTEHGLVVLGGVRVQLATPPSLDSDGDGLLDAWEIAHDLNPNSALDDDGMDGDPDRDGFTNANEQIAGTDPRDPNSCLRLTLSPAGTQRYRLSWPAVAGKKYQLEFADGQWREFRSFLGPGWPRLALSPEESFEDDVSMGEPPPASRVYRLRLVP